MISIRCPHCHVGLKVDESKLPPDIETFSCPKCKKSILVSFVFKDKKKEIQTDDSETLILSPELSVDKIGYLKVAENKYTPAQTILLHEGKNIIGRKSNSSGSSVVITTEDKQMSREHILIEVKKDTKTQYKHYLSDNNSKNRTLYNSSYLESGEIVVLRNNDQIQIGQTLLIFEKY